MENLNINFSVQELSHMVKEAVGNTIQRSLLANKEQIEKSIAKYFEKSIFDNKASQFESALDWAVERAFRDGIEQAMDELFYRELIAKKAKEILTNDNFIQELAEKKVRAALGLSES